MLISKSQNRSENRAQDRYVRKILFTACAMIIARNITTFMYEFYNIPIEQIYISIFAENTHISLYLRTSGLRERWFLTMRSNAHVLITSGTSNMPQRTQIRRKLR